MLNENKSVIADGKPNAGMMMMISRLITMIIALIDEIKVVVVMLIFKTMEGGMTIDNQQQSWLTVLDQKR